MHIDDATISHDDFCCPSVVQRTHQARTARISADPPAVVMSIPVATGHLFDTCR
jgi:hypothetical protein